MQTRSKTRKRGQVQHCYLDAKSKPTAIEPDVQLFNKEQSIRWANIPALVLEKIIAFDIGKPPQKTWKHLRYDDTMLYCYRAWYLEKLPKYANVCTQWRDIIMSSKRLLDGCRDISIRTCSEKYRGLVESGFLSALKLIRIGEDFGNLSMREKMDHMDFVRSHVNYKETALTKFDIQIVENTNIEAFVELLAMSPNASTFTLEFHDSSLGAQQRAEQYWKVLLSVFYCNANEKTITIDYCDQNRPTSPDWSFVNDSKYKRYKVSDTPGIIKNLTIQRRPSSKGLFKTGPDWSHFSTLFDCVTIDSATGYDIKNMSSIKAKCIQLRLFHGIPASKKAEKPQFVNCEKLEVVLKNQSTDVLNRNVHALNSLQHPNAHVILDDPLAVNDACPPDYWNINWKRVHVDYFANFLPMSSMKTLTYPLTRKDCEDSDCEDSDNRETVIFNCDEQFSSKFMAFIETQPIYIGNHFEGYVTLESAKKSFLQ